jgi:hypothetical protein
MAKKKKDKDKEDLADEKMKSDESDAEESIEDSEESDEKKDSGSKAKGKSGKSRGSLIRKWWIPGLIFLILAAAGITVFFRPDLLSLIKGKRSVDYSIDLTNDNLQEEGLSPFFIPPSADLSRGAARIDLTVIWDGVASVRYKNNELRVRAEVYDYLMAFAEKSEDLNSQKTVMEEGMSGIFRKSLGTKDLAIKIKELKFI